VPAGYHADRAWPLFIAIHGGMASGIGEFTLWRQYADQEGFLLLAPNFSGRYHLFEGGSDRNLVKLVEEVSVDYRVDRERILLSGFAWGGEFAYSFAMAYPGLAHTVAVFNAGGFSRPVRADREAAHPRFYLAVGAAEPQYPQDNQALADLLRRNGYQVELHVARGVGHSIPSAAIIDVLRLFREMTAP